jgi:2-oxoglutarate ferredoxin oxidoreductase subunit beta
MTVAETAPAAPALGFADYKSAVKPVWCPGCGDYAVLTAITKALAALKAPPETVALVSGIGCSSRIAAYVDVYGFHAVHGRALPVATGLKVARPELTVLVAGGDGDGFSIGGNHFTHACRRNLDLTYIVMDNSVYGMTKGQASPTTAADWTGSKLTPDGPGVVPFEPLEIALSAGAGYIARGFSGKPNDLARLIAEAVRYPGFALVQVLSPCVTYRPEQQKDYKAEVHDGFAGRDPYDPTTDRRTAFLALLDDDGRSCGQLYRAPPAPPAGRHGVHGAATLDSLAAAFRL